MRKQNEIRLSDNKGFNLIEILVTMLIMAVGLMGIAALQFKGLQYNHDAYSRSQINFLAYDISDRIRLNKANALNYVANYVVNPATPPVCDQALATAINDLGCWREQVHSALPPGSEANITQAAGLYEVELSWTDRGNLTHDITYSFQP